MKTAIVDFLQGDATLTSGLTGGVHDAPEISRQATPDAFGEFSELKPCVLVREGSATPWGPFDHSGRDYVQIYFYSLNGDAIETARQRVYDLLHRSKLAPSGADVGTFEVVHASDLPLLREESLDCLVRMSRYVCTVLRR